MIEDTDDGRYKNTKRCSSKAPQVFLQRQGTQTLSSCMQENIWQRLQKNDVSKLYRDRGSN